MKKVCYGMMLVSIVAGLAMLAAVQAGAASISEKSIELMTSVNFQHSSVSDGNTSEGLTQFDLDGTAGYFINNRIEVGGGLHISHQSAIGVSTTGVGLTASGFYNFATTGNVIPYAGLSLGFVSHGGDLGDSTEGIIPELTGGIRFPMHDVISMNVFAGYRHVTNALGYDYLSSNDVFLGFGVSWFLKGGIVH
jgi:hypothetical protein